MSVDRLSAELLIPLGAELGEGPVWLPARERLACVDIEGRRVHEFDTTGGAHRTWDLPDRVSLIAPTPDPNLLLVGLGAGIATLNLSDGQVGPCLTPEGHNPAIARFNDGKPDPQGRLWAGTMALKAEPHGGAFYRFARNEPSRREFAGVTVSNGLAWNLPGDTLYYIDSPTFRVDAFDFDGAKGELARRRVALVIPEAMGKPDGCTLDCEGMLWIAHQGTGLVTRWDLSIRSLLAAIAVPAPKVTSCAFGGPALDLLVITTMRRGLDAAALASCPQAGDVFVARPRTQGCPSPVCLL